MDSLVGDVLRWGAAVSVCLIFATFIVGCVLVGLVEPEE